MSTPSPHGQCPRADHVTVVCGPTAVGKGTVVKAAAAQHSAIWVAVSATTRAPRSGEVHGEHYWFVSSGDFDALVAEDGLLEWATVHGMDRYGTLRQPVVDALARGHEVILEIDVQGAAQVRRTWPQARTVFIEPPSWEELVRRLRGRAAETEEQMERRLESARRELELAETFDHRIVNGELSRCVSDLVGLLGLPPHVHKEG